MLVLGGAPSCTNTYAYIRVCVRGGGHAEVLVCISVCLCAGRGCGEGLVCRDSGLTPGYGFVNYDNFFASVLQRHLTLTLILTPTPTLTLILTPNPTPTPNQLLTTFSVISLEGWSKIMYSDASKP